MKNRRKKKIKKVKGIIDIHPLIHITQPREVVLPNVFLKRIHLPHRIRSTDTATAESATTAGAVPTAPSAGWTWSCEGALDDPVVRVVLHCEHVVSADVLLPSSPWRR
jgi:hypothetical protein